MKDLVFHSRDEPKESNNQENFFDLLRFFVNHNQGIKYVVLDKSLGYLKFLVHDIQKHIVLVVLETTNIILNDLGGKFFAI